MSMPQNHRFTVQLGASELILETGKLAEQAGGAVMLTEAARSC